MSEERRQLRAAVRAALERHRSPRENLGRGPDLDAWAVLAGEVGVSGLLVPGGLGGTGGSYADAAVVFEEAGRTLAPLPLMSTVGLATSVLLACDGSIAAPLRRIADAAVATVAMGRGISAVPAGDRGALYGSDDSVLDGAAAELLVARADTPEGVGLFAVGSDAAGLRRRRLESLDLTRSLARVEFDSTPAVLVARGEHADAALSVGVDLAIALWAAESVGAMRQCLAAAVEYAKQRVQFARPIGSFQAIKHKLVDVLLEVEMAQSSADLAVAAADDWLRAPGEQTRTALGVA
ncbi:MAG: acyl-CoA dehydrogenase family protein, partial [Mycobacterium sp.]